MKQFKLLSDMVINGYTLRDDSKAPLIMAQAEKGKQLTLYEDSLILEQANNRQFVRLLNNRERKQVADYLVKHLDNQSPYSYETPEYWKKVRAYENRSLKVHQFDPLGDAPADPTFWLIFNHYQMQ